MGFDSEWRQLHGALHSLVASIALFEQANILGAQHTVSENLTQIMRNSPVIWPVF